MKGNTVAAKKRLQNSITVLRNDSSFYSIPLPESQIQNSQIIILGEEHGVAANQELAFKMLKSLKSKFDFQILLLEASHSNAVTMNKYLNTGNSAYIDTAFRYLKGTLAWTNEYAAFWKNLYAYNITLAPEKRISCIGIDVENQYDAALNFLATITPDTSAFEEIQPAISKLKKIKFSDINVRDAWKLSEEIISSWREYESLYKTFYAGNYQDFKIVMQNIVNARLVHMTKRNSGKSKYNKLRDSIMYVNLLNAYNINPTARMYGVFGSLHVLQDRFLGIPPLAYLLNSNNSPYKDKVISIYMYYKNCEQIIRPDYRIKTVDNQFSNRIFNFYTEDHNAFFCINSPDAPSEKLTFYPYYNNSAHGLFQYILLVKNSKASQPYGSFN
jgi:uncharacterized iron-regulated protein